MKSIRTGPTVHTAEGDERIRTAVPAPSTDLAYVRRGVLSGDWHEERAVFALARLGYSRRVALSLVRRWISERPLSGGAA